MNQKSHYEPLCASWSYKADSGASIRPDFQDTLFQDLEERKSDGASNLKMMQLKSESSLGKVMTEKYSGDESTIPIDAAQESAYDDSSNSSKSDHEWEPKRDYELIGRIQLKTASG